MKDFIIFIRDEAIVDEGLLSLKTIPSVVVCVALGRVTPEQFLRIFKRIHLFI